MADDAQEYRELCRFRELFKGRFTESEAAVILQLKDGLMAAVQFVLTSEPDELRNLLEEERNSWKTVTKKINKMKGSSVFEQARTGRINTDARQFACAPCDHFWWRRTPSRKQVSCCNRCHRRYDPVPRDREWGWAEFHCGNCGNEFNGWYAIYMKVPCPICYTLVSPTRICPPNLFRKKRVTMLHVCAAPDCPGRNNHSGGPYRQLPDIVPNLTCVFPASRVARGMPRVICPSQEHDSTGSTVETFLSQNDLNKRCDQYFPCLQPIAEESPQVSRTC